MDLKDPLLSSYLSFGHFENFHIKLPLSTRCRQIINAFYKLIIFISAVKLFLIVACTWKPLKLYLIEVAVFEERQQRLLDIGLDIVHIGHLISFSYWTRLNKNPRQLKCFDFLFVSNFEELCKLYKRQYQLDQKATDKFLSKYRLFTSFLRPIQISYACFLAGCVFRCTYQSYHALGLDYVLHFGIILTVITSMAYILVVYFSISKYVLVYVSSGFLMLRIQEIRQLVHKHFMKGTKNQIISKNLKTFENLTQVR